MSAWFLTPFREAASSTSPGQLVPMPQKINQTKPNLKTCRFFSSEWPWNSNSVAKWSCTTLSRGLWFHNLLFAVLLSDSKLPKFCFVQGCFSCADKAVSRMKYCSKRSFMLFAFLWLPQPFRSEIRGKWNTETERESPRLLHHLQRGCKKVCITVPPLMLLWLGMCSPGTEDISLCQTNHLHKRCPWALAASYLGCRTQSPKLLNVLALVQQSS